MKRIVPVLAIALAITAVATRHYWLPSGNGARTYLGYVEGETSLIATPAAGRLTDLSVARGQPITKDALLFSLDPTDADADVARSTALLAHARAQLENLKTGKRQQELDVTRAQRREAEAALRYAELDLKRTSVLVPTGATSATKFDQATSQVAQLRAKVEMLIAEEAAGELGGRVAERQAAEAKIGEAEANLRKAERQRIDIAPTSPVTGRVENTFFEPGEWVAAGTPVVSLIADDKTKLRFFVPEREVARAVPGATVKFRCDSCAPGQEAVITYVSPRAEFTPPVIYSTGSRDKLVFMVEALPRQSIAALRLGLPVEVEPIEVKP